MATYYATLLADNARTKRQTVPVVMLLTDDAENKRKAMADGLQSFTVKEFVELQVPEVSSRLVDLIAAVGTGQEKKRGAALFDEVSRYDLEDYGC